LGVGGWGLEWMGGWVDSRKGDAVLDYKL
jgi:hypothetical protein